jgi:hypothetical protein
MRKHEEFKVIAKDCRKYFVKEKKKKEKKEEEEIGESPKLAATITTKPA